MSDFNNSWIPDRSRSPLTDSTLQTTDANSNDLSTSIPLAKLWLAAIKPPMYSVAIMPILVGTAIAHYQTAVINWRIFSTFLFSAMLILAWENLCNDVFDAETGIDLYKFHSVVNLTGRKNLVLAIANTCLVAGVTGVGLISWWQQDFTVVGLVLGCCGMGYLYQAPPFRLGYQGWGELLCFFSFGPLAVSAAYYSQTQAYSFTALLASAMVGIATSLILFSSHFNQVTDDCAAGKRSPVVQLGSKRAAWLLPGICTSVYAIALFGILGGAFPLAVSWVGLGLLPAGQLCFWVIKNYNREDLLKNCRFIAVAFHFCSCLGLTLGFLV